LRESKGYIITEGSTTSSAPIITQENQNVVKFEAELQEADKPNRNGRIYDYTAINQALQYYAVQEKLKHKTFFGRQICPSL